MSDPILSQTTDRFVVQSHGSVVVITPAADIESLEWEQIEKSTDSLIAPAMSNDPPRLIFDLAEMTYFASVFLSVLIRCWKQVDQAGGQFAVCGAGEHALEVLRLTALDTLWPVYPDRQSALDALLDEG